MTNRSPGGLYVPRQPPEDLYRYGIPLYVADTVWRGVWVPVWRGMAPGVGYVLARGLGRQLRGAPR